MHDAESLLLHLLPYISAEQLHAATSALNSTEVEDSRSGSPDRRSSPPVLNKKTGIDYWESFPLTSMQDVRRWQQDCEVHGSMLREPFKDEQRSSSPATQQEKSSIHKRRVNTTSPPVVTNGNFNDPNTSLSAFSFPNGNYGVPQPMLQNRSISFDMSTLPTESWQSATLQSNAILPRSHGSMDISQQELYHRQNFGNQRVPSMWQSSSGMDMMSIPAVSEHGSLPIVNQQTHSHLFW